MRASTVVDLLFWSGQLKEGFNLGPTLAATVNRSPGNLDRDRCGKPGSLHGPPKPLQLDNALRCDERVVAAQDMTAAVDEHGQVVHAAQVALNVTQTEPGHQTSHRGIGRALTKRHRRIAAHPAADQRMSWLLVTLPTHPTDPPLPPTTGQASCTNDSPHTATVPAGHGGSAASNRPRT